MRPPLGLLWHERFALWELFPIVPPLWDEVSAAAGGFPWLTSEPKTAELAEDNGGLLSFSVKAVLMFFKRLTCILRSRWATKNGHSWRYFSYLARISSTVNMQLSREYCSWSGIAPKLTKLAIVASTLTLLRGLSLIEDRFVNTINGQAQRFVITNYVGFVWQARVIITQRV